MFEQVQHIFKLMLAIGIWSFRRTRTDRDFFIAGQGIGLFVTGLATMSAAFSVTSLS